MSWLSDLFSGSSGPTLNGPGSYPWDPQQQQPSAAPGVTGQTPNWANTLQILGATLKDVGNQGKSDNVGATSKALQEHQQFVLQALARQNLAQSLTGGGAPQPNPVNITPQVQTPGQNAGMDLGGSFSAPPPDMDSMKSALMRAALSGIDITPFISAAKLGAVSPEQQRLAAKDKADATQVDFNTLDKGGDAIDAAMKPSDVSLGSAAPGLSFQQRQVVAAEEQRKAQAASPEGKAADAAAVAKAQLPFQKELIGERSDAAIEAAAARAATAHEAAQFDLTDPSDKSYIDAIANYRARPPSAGRNPAQRQAAIEAAIKVNPNYNEALYDQSAKALRDFGTGKQGDTARSLNVSVAHLETLRELGRALDNGNVNLINAAKQRFSEEFGVPAPTNFDTAKSIVADEVAKGVIGGQSAQSDRETLSASLKRSGSFKQIDGAINTFQSLLGGQLRGLRDQYKRTTRANDFDTAFLSEATRNALEGKDSTPSTAVIPPPGADGWTVMPNGVRVRLKAK